MGIAKRASARSVLLALCVFALAIVMVACGSESDDGTTGGSTTTSDSSAGSTKDVEFTVGRFAAPMIIVAGEAMGSFDDLSMNLTELTGGPEALPLLTSGDLAGASDVSEPPVAIAIARDIPMKVVWQANSTTVALLVDSSIQGPEDLKGKTFGAPAGSIMHLKLLQYLEENGLSPEDINFVDMGAPEAVTAFKSGAIDGTNLFPPFSEAVKADGAKVLEESNVANVLIVGDGFIEDHPEVVQTLICRLADVQEAAIQNPKPAYEAIAKFLELPANEVPAMLPQNLIVSPDEMTGPKYLGPGGEFAKNVVAAGNYLSEIGELSGAPNLDEVNAAIDLQFVEGVQNGECS
ncbi:MAG: ABC transporter substrate-binding protein [Solirubrobacterales bacterium]